MLRRRSASLHLRSRWRVLVAIWGMATVAGLIVARTTKLGPVLAILAPGHGLHLGDVAGFAVCYLTASVATFGLARDQVDPVTTRRRATGR